MNESELKRFMSNMTQHVNELCEDDNMRVGNLHDDDSLFIIMESWNTVYKLNTYLAIEGGVYDLFQYRLDHPTESYHTHGKALLSIIPGPTPVLFPDIYVNNKREYRLIDSLRDIVYNTNDDQDRTILFQDLVHEFWNVYGEYGFSDEYDTCAACGKIIRTSPDSYSYQPDYILDEYEGYIHVDCVDVDDVLESHKNANKALPPAIQDKAIKDGLLVELNDHRYENGMHPGMNDDPKIIIAAFKQVGIDLWFDVQPSQFYVEFTVLVHPDNMDVSNKILDTLNTYQGFDNAAELDKALRGIHSDYIHVESRTISQQDFIDGNL